MDALIELPLAVTLLSAAWMVATMIRIQEFLRARGRKVNPLLLRVMIFRYVAEYRRLTIAEHGRPGVLYRHLSVAGLLTLASAAVLVAAAGWG